MHLDYFPLFFKKRKIFDFIFFLCWLNLISSPPFHSFSFSHMWCNSTLILAWRRIFLLQIVAYIFTWMTFVIESCTRFMFIRIRFQLNLICDECLHVSTTPAQYSENEHFFPYAPHLFLQSVTFFNDPIVDGLEELLGTPICWFINI